MKLIMNQREEIAKKFVELKKRSKEQKHKIEYEKAMKATNNCIIQLSEKLTNNSVALQQNLQKKIEEIEVNMKKEVEHLKILDENVEKLIELQKNSKDKKSLQENPLEENVKKQEESLYVLDENVGNLIEFQKESKNLEENPLGENVRK